MAQRSDHDNHGKSTNLDRFALLALSILAEDMRMTGRLTQERRELFVKELYKAVSSLDSRAAPTLVQKMLKHGIDPVELAGYYIPEVARQLGEAWCADMMDFANVTIGSARLQGLLRTLGPEWCGEDLVHGPDAHRCLVLVPEDAQHTLGATILAGQLRQNGVMATLEIARPLAELDRILDSEQFDTVMISASASESLDVIRRIVHKISRKTGDTSVIIGGSILSLAENVAELTGADLATSDLEEALRFCGINAAPAPAEAGE